MHDLISLRSYPAPAITVIEGLVNSPLLCDDDIMKSVLGNDDLSTLEQKIRELAEAWLRQSPLYYLSKLGKDLNGDLQVLKSRNIGLGEFVAERLDGDFEIVLTGPHRNVQALVRSPGKKEEGNFTADLLDDKNNDNFRYNYRFWAAFAVPIKGGRRFLNLHDFSFRDSDESPGLDYQEIEESLIPSGDLPERDAVIRKNIEIWLTQTGWSKEKFSAKPRKTVKPISVEARSLLELIIETLDRHQLSTTALSLDVIASLHRRRV